MVTSVFILILTTPTLAARDTSGPWRKLVPLTASWQTVTIRWSDLMPGWGDPHAFDVTRLYGIDIVPNPPVLPGATAPMAGWDWDLCVDSVSFF